MGKADEYQFDYLGDDERFVDQVNGALFKGRQVLKPGELEPADGERRYNMCKAFMDMKLGDIEEGIEKGRISHLIETVCKNF